MDVKVRVFVKEIRNGLSLSKTQNDIEKWLRVLKVIVTDEANDVETACVLESFGWTFDEFSSLKIRVLKFHIRKLLDCIIPLFTVQWIWELTPEKFHILVKPIFFRCVSEDGFICLFQMVCFHEKKDFLFYKCVSLLEELITRQHLYHILKCYIICRHDESTTKSFLTADAEILVSSLSSLPEKMANRLQHDNSEIFLPQTYIPKIALSIYDSLTTSVDMLSRNQDVSLLMISTLIGKLCLVGYTDLFMDTIMPYLSVKVRTDYLWCRVCQRVFSCMPARNMEPVITALMKKIPWYGLIEKFIGDCVINSSGVKNLLCVKFLLHKYYSEPRQLLHNLIGYLSSSQTRRQLFMEVFIDLLRVWGDASSMKHISNEQHIYISKALMLSTSLLNGVEKHTYKNELIRILMPGVQAHLENNNHDIRMVGMTMAKSLIASVDPDGPQLEFEVDESNSKIKDLLSFQGLPEDIGFSEAEKSVQTMVNMENGDNSNQETDTNLGNRMETLGISDVERDFQDELDSDDDLVPYDMSNDKKVTEAKPPKYVRDCMEGLISANDNPAKTEICLQRAESLIRRNTDGLTEISAEFTKILLHMNDTHSFDNFLKNRFSAMVALTVMCPSPVADYLTSQFYERNYNTRQRLDILEVLANAAQELSQPEKTKLSNDHEKFCKPVTEISPSSQPSSWRQVVQKRIEANTRRFAKGRTHPVPIPTENRFSKVAGQFFYPLMTQVDRSEPCMDLLGKDSLLLYRLLYTLAIILHSATNLTNATPMGRSLLEFTWPLRSHADFCVRQAVLVCTTTIFLVVPTFQLMSELYTDVVEVKEWLEDVFEKDPDAECQKMAAQALLLLDEQIKKEITKDNPTST